MGDTDKFFGRDQRITWSDHAKENYPATVKRHGPGPFMVKSVTVVPDNLCGECATHPADEDCPHDDGVGHKTLREKVGPQLLTIAPVGGTEISGSFGNILFQHAPVEP